MTYYDTSALVKRYIDEAGRDLVESVLDDDLLPVTAALSVVEVRRALARIDSALERVGARMLFDHEITAFQVVVLDERVIEHAAAIAEFTGVRSLDALHLASATMSGSTRMVTFDIRQGRVARQLGIEVVGC